jgi:hypothetical protein
MRLLVVCAIATALSTACQNDPAFCTAIFTRGLIVHVKSASSGADICDAKVTATDTSSHHVYDLSTAIGCDYSGVGAGTFDVRVERAGFVPASVSGVKIRPQGECGTLVDQVVNVSLASAP